MYLEHFGLRELPFSITPDTEFVYRAQSHQEALNTLLVALNGGEGFIKVTGEVGTGKTLLCRHLLRSLPENSLTAYLPNPQLSPHTLLVSLCEELDITADEQLDNYRLIQQITHHLIDTAVQEKLVVICIDEAQAMPLETLETLRLLSNLETEKRKLLQIIILGQPELDKHLSDPSVRQLQQRIAFHYRLSPLSKEEVAAYIDHRLRIAGYEGANLFNDAAARLLHRASRGTPRVVNILAHKALLAAFGQGRRAVEKKDVRSAAADTQGTPWLGWW